METITSEAQWLEKFASISQEIQLEDIFEKSKYDLTISLEYSDDDESEDDSDDHINNHKDDHTSETASSVIKKRLIKISPLFAGQPKFESICRDQSTQFVLSGLTSYRFLFPNPDDPIYKFHKKADDLECTIHLWGHNLSEITIYEYPSSKIFQIINTACPNLRKFDMQLKEIESEDFENIFSNMAHLEELDIYWNCENSTLPTSLVKSMEQVGGTLKSLNLTNISEADCRLPDSFASVFPRLIVLEQLFIHSFGHLNQALIQSVSKIENLLVLVLDTCGVEDPQSNLYPIGNLKNLKVLEIRMDCGVTDQLLINLSNNAKNLIALSILGTNITDNGIMALSKCTQLIKLDLNSGSSQKNNEFITDKSVEYLFCNKNLKELNISNCIEITNSAVLKLVKNLTNLRELYPKKTTVTVELAKELRDITEYREKSLWIYVPKEQHNCFNSFESDKLFFVAYLK